MDTLILFIFLRWIQARTQGGTSGTEVPPDKKVPAKKGPENLQFSFAV